MELMKAGGVISIFSLVVVTTALGQGLVTIQEIQRTDHPDGDSLLNEVVVDCVGGIVVFKREANKPRLVLVDPNAVDGWGGIQVKGWSPDIFDNVAVGDWVRLEGVLVEENVGTTFLQFSASFMEVASQLTIVSRSNPLPPPQVIAVDAIGVPIYFAADDAWLTPDKVGERFESMIVQIRDVRVSALNLGAKNDNYSLQAVNRDGDPNALLPECWVSDYMNRDGDKTSVYMPPVVLDRHFCAVTGLVEQYNRPEDGYDVFQLLTLSQNSFMRMNPADLDLDCDVDLWDAQRFTAQLLGEEGGLEGDFNEDGVIDMDDWLRFNEAWQNADFNGDGTVDGDDLHEMPL
jgi:hypothetical protein